MLELGHAIILALVATIPATAAALAAWWQAKLNQKRIETVHVQINGRLDGMIEAARVIARAEGVIEGQAIAKKIRK